MRKELKATTGFIEFCSCLGEAEPGKIISSPILKKRITGNAGYSGLLQQEHRPSFATLARKVRNVGQNVVSAFRDVRTKTDPIENIAKLVSFRRILLNETLVDQRVQLRQAHGYSILQRRWGAHIDQIVHVSDPLCPSRRTYRVSDSPSSDAKSFGEPGNGNCPLPKLLDRARANVRTPIVEEVFVDLVREDKQVVTRSKLCQAFQFGTGKHFP